MLKQWRRDTVWKHLSDYVPKLPCGSVRKNRCQNAKMNHDGRWSYFSFCASDSGSLIILRMFFSQICAWRCTKHYEILSLQWARIKLEPEHLSAPAGCGWRGPNWIAAISGVTWRPEFSLSMRCFEVILQSPFALFLFYVKFQGSWSDVVSIYDTYIVYDSYIVLSLPRALPEQFIRPPRLMCEISESGVRAHDGATEVSLNRRLFQSLDALKSMGKPWKTIKPPTKTVNDPWNFIKTSLEQSED